VSFKNFMVFRYFLGQVPHSASCWCSGIFRFPLVSARLRQYIKICLMQRASPRVWRLTGSSCLIRCPCVSRVCPILSLLIITSWRLFVRNVVGQGCIEDLIWFSFVCRVAQRCCHWLNVRFRIAPLMSFGEQIWAKVASGELMALLACMKTYYSDG